MEELRDANDRAEELQHSLEKMQSLEQKTISLEEQIGIRVNLKAFVILYQQNS